MRKSFLYRIYPTKQQEAALVANLDRLRRLYNECLERRKTAYETEKRTVGFAEQSRWFTVAKQDDPEYRLLHRQHAQAMIMRIDKAFKAFFRRVKEGEEEPGYPRFKGGHFFNSIELPAYGNGFRVDGDRLVINNVGSIKINMHRPCGGQIKTGIVKRRAGKWYASLSCDLGDVTVPTSRMPTAAIVLGLDIIATASDGEIYEAPMPLHRSLELLRERARQLSQKMKYQGDLRLIAQATDASELPTEGEDLIVVASVDGEIHFRAFNKDGMKVVDKSESEIQGNRKRIGVMKGLVKKFARLPVLTNEEVSRVISKFKYITGYSPEFGKNWLKAKVALGKLHATIADQRKDHHHKLSNILVARYGTIILEPLPIADEMENGDDARSQADAAWGYIIQMIKYKAETTGTTVVELDRATVADLPEFANDLERSSAILARFMQGRAGPVVRQRKSPRQKASANPETSSVKDLPVTRVRNPRSASKIRKGKEMRDNREATGA